MEELGGAKVHCRKSGVGDLEVADDAGVHRGGQALPLLLPLQLRAEAADARDRRPRDRMSEKLLDIVPESPRQPYDMYDVISRDRRRRRVLRHQAEVRQDAHHLPRALRRPAVRDRRQPAQAARRHPRERLRRQGGALHQPLRRLQHPAALPPGRARVHGRLEGRARRDHPPRGEDALRGLARHRAEGHGRRPQGLRRRLLRDVRQGLRARPDRRLADGRDLGHGRRRARSTSSAARRSRPPTTPRPPGRRCSTRSATRSTPTSPPATP